MFIGMLQYQAFKITVREATVGLGTNITFAFLRSYWQWMSLFKLKIIVNI